MNAAVNEIIVERPPRAESPRAEPAKLAVVPKPNAGMRPALMNGWEATRAVKADPLTADVPVIALTARSMPGDREKAVEAGCDDYDTKPVDLPRLLAKMAAIGVGA